MTDSLPESLLPLADARCAVAQPAPRLPDFERPPDPRLTAEGWERRFMADGERLAEYVELYSSLGYEVRHETVQPEEISEQCSDCRLVICQQFVTLYTRRSAAAQQKEAAY